MTANIWSDMTIAIELASKASTPDRRLAGAEWLHQLAGQLVELIRQEQQQPEQAAEETPDPGEGWRMLEEGEILQVGDEWQDHYGAWYPTESAGDAAECIQYRRRVAPATPAVEPNNVRYFKHGRTVWKVEPNGHVFCRAELSEAWNAAAMTLEKLVESNTLEITREQAIQITGEP